MLLQIKQLYIVVPAVIQAMQHKLLPLSGASDRGSQLVHRNTPMQPSNAAIQHFSSAGTHQPELISSVEASSKATTMNLRSMAPLPHIWLQEQCNIVNHKLITRIPPFNLGKGYKLYESCCFITQEAMSFVNFLVRHYQIVHGLDGALHD